MSGANLQHLLAMILYMAAVVGIGIYFAGRANKDAESYFLGGRSLGPWVTAFSAEASDMSGYLLMGLPGLAYWTGLADAGCVSLESYNIPGNYIRHRDGILYITAITTQLDQADATFRQIKQ